MRLDHATIGFTLARWNAVYYLTQLRLMGELLTTAMSVARPWDDFPADPFELRSSDGYEFQHPRDQAGTTRTGFLTQSRSTSASICLQIFGIGSTCGR